uniref:NADH-ubiquinone oxidoreductase chain 3 n=1 Tax=Tetrancistrum nebulosi TaxID=879209 RepID=I3NLR9_9PLAT|nr:NADH dehydrogenase subunit 3 [Tetrancistrum nebulosi]ADN44062.1 NADH dehydrogenase subunit 3 [Tetrancistrum nebulosi]
MVGVLLIMGILGALIAFYNSNYFFMQSISGASNLSVWVSSFECGFVSHCVKVNSFGSGFFILLVFFVLFDLEVSLLLNCVFQEEFFKNLVYYTLFILVVSVGFMIEVHSGFVSWSNS